MFVPHMLNMVDMGDMVEMVDKVDNEVVDKVNNDEGAEEDFLVLVGKPPTIYYFGYTLKKR